MSILPMYKLCPRCGWSVPFNPDVGRLCPDLSRMQKAHIPAVAAYQLPFSAKKVLTLDFTLHL